MLFYILTFPLFETEFVIWLKGGVVHINRNMVTEHTFKGLLFEETWNCEPSV